MSKGNTRRPCQIGSKEEDLRWQLAYGKITVEEFKRECEKLEQEGKITRSGRRMNA